MARWPHGHKALMPEREPVFENAKRHRSICSKEWLPFGR